MLQAPQAVAFVQPLLARSSEIRTANPIVSYFGLYRAVQQVLETKLHVSDKEVADFATQLLNEIEDLKQNNPKLQTEDAKEILAADDVAEAYVLDFAATIFDRADGATREHRVTKATGAGFAAAASFLSLEQIWGELTPETAEKIKYAKFHAARILRAVKNGENPNDLYEDLEVPAELADSPSVHSSEIEAPPAVDAETAASRGEELATDETSLSKRDEDTMSTTPEAKQVLTPVQSPPGVVKGDSEPADTVPAVNEATVADEGATGMALPQAPTEDPRNDLSLPEAPHDQPQGNMESDLDPLRHVPSESDATIHIVKKQERQSSQPVPTPPKKVPVKPQKQSATPKSAIPPQVHSPEQVMQLTKVTGNAQKHAKYAISALNYDDIATAISELDAALATLKAFQNSN